MKNLLDKWGQNYKSINNKYIYNLFRSVNIPKKRIIFLHCSLRNLKLLLEQSYKDISKAILISLISLFEPKTILVPAFTYSFTKTGLYHRIFSKSEVGRFSEEVRCCLANYRTPDPIFSVLDISDFLLKNEKEIDYTTAFGRNSMFDFLNEDDGIILNFNLEEIVSTQLHYAEKVNEVSYRYDKVFNGVIYYDEYNWKKIKYKYFVRDLDHNPKWNREKIENYLISTGVLQTHIKDDIKISWFSSKSMLKAINTQLKKNQFFLIE